MIAIAQRNGIPKSVRTEAIRLLRLGQQPEEIAFACRVSPSWVRLLRRAHGIKAKPYMPTGKPDFTPTPEYIEQEKARLKAEFMQREGLIYEGSANGDE